jgi:crotonobetaine/carnitine-CoA ligase
VPNIVELARLGCERNPGAPAIIFEDGLVLGRRELLNRVESFASYLKDRVSPGDRVAIILENRAEFMIAWLAIVACRATMVSINTAVQAHDGGHILRDSAAKVVITGEAGETLVKQLQPDLPELRELVKVGAGEPDGLGTYKGSSNLDWSQLGIRPDDATNVYYTSGSTGPPKGCILDHTYWLRFVDLFLRLYGMGPEDRLLSSLQFFYGDPPWMMLASLISGGSLVAMRRFSVSRYWGVVRQHGVTIIFGIASIPSLLLRQAAGPDDKDHQVKFALQVGIQAHLHRSMEERWGFPWVEGYGLTETGLVVAMPMAYAAEMTGSGSIGLPCPEAEARVVSAEGSVLGPGEVGEILIKAPGLMKGYLNRPDATAETIRGGWLFTGDLGHFDDRGFLYFNGRKKDIVRRSGENVAAAEVEQVLRSHPLVLEAAVVPVPDDLRGEEVKAFILLIDGATPDQFPPEEVVDYCAKRLARYKVPRYIEYRREDFPRTPSMRVKKQALLEERGDQISGCWDRESETSPPNRDSL